MLHESGITNENLTLNQNPRANPLVLSEALPSVYRLILMRFYGCAFLANKKSLRSNAKTQINSYTKPKTHLSLMGSWSNYLGKIRFGTAKHKNSRRWISR